MSNDAASQVESNYAIYLKNYKAEAERDHKGEVALDGRRRDQGDTSRQLATRTPRATTGTDLATSRSNRSEQTRSIWALRRSRCCRCPRSSSVWRTTAS